MLRGEVRSYSWDRSPVRRDSATHPSTSFAASDERRARERTCESLHRSELRCWLLLPE
jgi:hypothetical protein